MREKYKHCSPAFHISASQDAIEQGVFVVDGPRGARGGSVEPEVDMELVIMTLAEVGQRTCLGKVLCVRCVIG